MTPSVSLLLCTVRGSAAYLDHPNWHVIGKVLADLAVQVDAPPFELVIVDGLWSQRSNLSPIITAACEGLEHPRPFPIRHLPPPAHSPWPRIGKVAICAYRNAGIAACRGDLIINLDDCCVLPPNFVVRYWTTWRRHGLALGATWPGRGDARAPGDTSATGEIVYGFGSYPRELAVKLNGYDEAYDGAQGLEDADWSIRLRMAGLRQHLTPIPGFDIEKQSPHAATAIDPERPIVKCCNAAWQCQRVARSVLIANRAELWPEAWLRKLVGPCVHLGSDGMCGHHRGLQRCAYIDEGFAVALDEQAAAVLDNPPVIDLAEMTRTAHGVEVFEG